MGQRSDIDNLHNLNTCTVYGTDSGLTTVTGTLHISFHLAKPKVKSDLCAILCCHLSSIRCVLLRATESHLTC